MSTGSTQALGLAARPKRKVPRYKLTVPLSLTVLRSGIPDHIPGRTLEIGEGGMGVVAASQLLLGESVRVEFLLPHMTLPVRATAVVRYQRDLCFGLQFLRLPLEQQSVIRYWTRCEAELSLAARKSDDAEQAALSDAPVEPALLPVFEDFESLERRSRIRRILALSVAIVVMLGLLQWWHWRQEWARLEAGIPPIEAFEPKPRLNIPGEIMQRRLRHKVAPEYPENARRAKIQGTVLLDAVVTEEGAVTQMNFVSGPPSLSLAAMDAVRWWRYEPYLVNAQPVPVQTTIAVDFPPAR